MTSPDMTSLETILTSILGYIGVTSPIIIGAVRFLVKEYNKLSQAAALIEAYDARFEELDQRLKAAGVRDPDTVVTMHIRRLKGSLRESFSRRDLQIDALDSRVEHIKEEQRATVAAMASNYVKMPQDLVSTKAKIVELEKTVRVLTSVSKASTEKIDSLIVGQGDAAARIHQLQDNQKPAAINIVDSDAGKKVKELEVEVIILKRALMKLGKKLGVDLSFELHQTPEKTPPKAASVASAPAVTTTNGTKTPGDTLDYKAMSKDRAAKIAKQVDEDKLLADISKEHEEEEEE